MEKSEKQKLFSIRKEDKLSKEQYSGYSIPGELG